MKEEFFSIGPKKDRNKECRGRGGLGSDLSILSLLPTPTRVLSSLTHPAVGLVPIPLSLHTSGTRSPGADGLARAGAEGALNGSRCG